MNYFLLEINSIIYGRAVNIYPAIIIEGKEMILVDTGYPGQFELLRSTAQDKGINFENLTKIIITHQDIDHIGSLAEFKRKFKNVMVLASLIESDYISGKKQSLRLEKARINYEQLPEEQKTGALSYLRFLENIEKTDVDIILNDNDLIPGCPGVRVIATPGHLPGHISLFLERAKTFIAGDAIGLNEDGLYINSQYTLDMVRAKESIKKICACDIENIICYHGGLFKGDCRKALIELSKTDER